MEVAQPQGIPENINETSDSTRGRKRFMPNQWGPILGIYGILLTVLFAVIGFMLSGWIAENRDGRKDILKTQVELAGVISELRTEQKLMDQRLETLEEELDERFNAMERRFEQGFKGQLGKRLATLERNVHIILQRVQVAPGAAQ